MEAMDGAVDNRRVLEANELGASRFQNISVLAVGKWVSFDDGSYQGYSLTQLQSVTILPCLRLYVQFFLNNEAVILLFRRFSKSAINIDASGRLDMKMTPIVDGAIASGAWRRNLSYSSIFKY